MNIVHEYYTNMQWLELHSNYNAWYEHIRDRIFEGNHWCAYDNFTKENCLMFIDIYKKEQKDAAEILHPMSYTIISRQVRIDLLYHRLSVILREELARQDKK